MPTDWQIMPAGAIPAVARVRDRSKKVFGYFPSPQTLNEPKSLHQRPSGAEALRSLSPQLQSIASAIESAIRCSHLQPFLADGGVRGEILGTALEHDAALPHDVEPRPSVDAEPAEVFTFTARWIMRVSGEAACG